jgi:uncharacterized membrane protein YphA (DoxX/SURF4 family)
MLYAAVPKFFNLEGISWANLSTDTLPPPLDLAPFARSVYNFRVLPIPLVNLMAMTLVPLETLGGVCLLLGIWVRPASLILSLLLTAFLAAIGQAIIRGLDIDCGCFVGFETKVGFYPIARDSVLLAGFVAVFVSSRGEPIRDHEKLETTPD